jgi:hypothetical protein
METAGGKGLPEFTAVTVSIGDVMDIGEKGPESGVLSRLARGE